MGFGSWWMPCSIIVEESLHHGWMFWRKKEKSAYADWFMIHDWETVEKRADTRDGRFYSFAFTDGMPKLNTNNEEVISILL